MAFSKSAALTYRAVLRTGYMAPPKIGTAIAKLQRPLLRQTNQGTPWEGFGHEPRARVALIDVCSPVQSVKTRIEGVLLDQRMEVRFGSK